MSVQVSVIMGSKSDWETMQHACVVLEELGISYEKKVISAHRTPDLMFQYAEAAAARGLRVIIAGAGGAAHLPGMVAAKTILPVIGVPVQSKALNGLGFAALHRADARRYTGGDSSDRQVQEP
jgi:5-(carboxyamino)imidazole ribonucleotide mutase